MCTSTLLECTTELWGALPCMSFGSFGMLSFMWFRAEGEQRPGSEGIQVELGMWTFCSPKNQYEM